MTEEFNIETMIGSADSEKQMQQHRDMLDDGAKAHSRSSRFVREELLPNIVRVQRPLGSRNVVDLPETEESRRYKIMRRWYR